MGNRRRRNWKELTPYDTAAIRNSLQHSIEGYKERLDKSVNDVQRDLYTDLLKQYEDALHTMQIIGAGSAWIKIGDV